MKQSLSRRTVRGVRRPARFPVVPVLIACVIGLAACGSGLAPATPPVTPGTSERPREVNVIARDYTFTPTVIDLVPGETILLHVVNGGLAVHEVVIGDQATQDAWAAAESVAANPPPGPTPLVEVPAATAGLRIVVGSGERHDVVWTVPAVDQRLLVGCHIADHWERGMQAQIRLVGPGGAPLPAPASP